MKFFNDFKEWWNRSGIETLKLTEPMDLKKAFDLQQVGVTGRAAPMNISRENLERHYKRNELVFACIQKISQSAIDPTPIIQKVKSDDEWDVVKGHPLTRLLSRPNPLEDGSTFWGAWLASEEIFGESYAEIVRNDLGQPIQLWLL